MKRPLKSDEFDELLNLYPEFLRPGILTILEFINYKKSQGTLQKVYLYTNNQCGKEWVDRITAYIDVKIGATKPLFDDKMYAFKIKQKILDVRRTTNNKTHDDFIKCTLLKDTTTEICFIDDVKYSRMCNDNVYYIKPRPYTHSLSKHEIIKRLLEHIPASVAPFNRDVLHSILYKYCSGFVVKSTDKLVSDIEITKKIMYHVREFLYFCGNRSDKGKTCRKRRVGNRKTIKKLSSK